VATLLSANGFEVHDLGVNVPLEELVAVAQEVEADIIGVSALLTTTMVRQRDLARMMDDLGLRPRIKLMIGGAPVTRSWADEIGADGFSEDAVGAVTVARQLVTATAAA
jgi:methanogenic corrinoid protein MtbC1